MKLSFVSIASLLSVGSVYSARPSNGRGHMETVCFCHEERDQCVDIPSDNESTTRRLCFWPKSGMELYDITVVYLKKTHSEDGNPPLMILPSKDLEVECIDGKMCEIKDVPVPSAFADGKSLTAFGNIKTSKPSNSRRPPNDGSHVHSAFRLEMEENGFTAGETVAAVGGGLILFQMAFMLGRFCCRKKAADNATLAIEADNTTSAIES